MKLTSLYSNFAVTRQPKVNTDIVHKFLGVCDFPITCMYLNCDKFFCLFSCTM